MGLVSIGAERGHGFVVKPEYDGDQRLIRTDDDREPTCCDGGPHGLLEFDATSRQAG
jgi:hypothetical protein